MRAMILNKPGVLERSKIDRPITQEGNVLVHVNSSGICGTDLKIYSGAIPVAYPRIMGHELIGEIAETNDPKVAVGTRVIIDPVIACGSCYQCQAGQTNLCPTGGLMGREQDGGFADFVPVPANNVYALPDSIKNKEASLLQVLTTCVHAQKLSPIIPGNSVVVIGLGVTGQLHMQLAKESGASPVIGITRSAKKRKLAEDLGADATFEPREGLKSQILDLTEGRGADLVIESVGKIVTLSQAIDLVRIGGCILNFGIYTETQGELPFYQLYNKELLIINARAAKSDDFTPSIEMVNRGAVKLNPLISHQMPLENLSTALETLGSPAIDTMKIILEH